MRFLVYLMSLLFVGTAIAQNPTILQGSYISNVFGQSNFILNPNAQTNVANVTTVTATVTRSTTTPLVATSEFTVAITSANGTATWATRAFDAGMKGQNCEARFTYRGFAATSKVHIKQGANTVATLNLTPATDPRIASINFPCGDLSTATTFVVTDTAILAGTNEISGIYTGLATNMANVAQAETVVIAKRSTSQSIPDVTYTTVVYNSEDKDVYNEFDTTTGEFTAKRAGVYQIYGSIFWSSATWSGANLYISIFKNGVQIANWLENGFTGTKFLTQQKQFDADLAVGDKITIRAYNNSGGAKNIEGDVIYTQLTIKRFPSSSELVVTPERQNTFAAASWESGQSFSRSTTAEITISDGVFATNRTAYGKAQFTATANDVAITVPQMPAGTYKIELTGKRLFVQNSTAATRDIGCYFYLKDGTNTAQTDATQYGIQFSIDGISTATQIVRYTSVADRTFTASLASAYATATTCGVNAPKIIITPLDQPSNSALYVEGPVKASATGAAIPAGYVGQVLQSKAGIINISSSAYTNLNTVTLTNGVWLCSTQSRIMRNGATVPSSNEMVSCIGNSASANCNVDYSYQTIGTGLQDGMSLTYNYKLIGSKPTVVRYDGTNFTFADGTVSASATGTLAHKVYADATSGQLQAYGFLECVRLN